MSLLDHSLNLHDIVFLEQFCTFRSFHKGMVRTKLILLGPFLQFKSLKFDYFIFFT